MSVRKAKFHSPDIVMKALRAMGRITVIMASKRMQEGEKVVTEAQQKMADNKKNYGKYETQ
jgi:hypothetical protein